MAKQQTASRRKSGSGGKASSYEEQLTELLQERIKPNLNRGSIPLLARSLAKDIAARQRSDEAQDEDEDEPADEAAGADDERDEQAQAEEPEAEAGDEEPANDEASEDDEDREPAAEADDEASEDVEDEESEDEPEGDGEDPVSAFEEEMHQLQEDLGDDWIVRFSVQNDEAWLTAEKEDGSQHVEGPTADVLREAVELLEGGGDGGD